MSDKRHGNHGRDRQATGGRRRAVWLGAAAVALGVLAALVWMLQAGNLAASPIEFTDVREQTRQFMAYYDSIQLTPEQEAVKKEALSAVPAPCCSDNTAYTCCCPCNMAKTWWGLAHHLIADRGLGAKEVQAAVEAWIEFINPEGFSGNSCYTGGCVKPFKGNGCGGMDPNRVVF